MRKILVCLLVFGASLVAADWALKEPLPQSIVDRAPILIEIPPLQPVTRTSVIVTPITISLATLREAMEEAAPRNVTGKRPNPNAELLSDGEIFWNINRGPIAVAARSGALAISTPLNGSVRATGKVSQTTGSLAGALASVFGEQFGRDFEKSLTGRPVDQRADIRGNVAVTARPSVTTGWRLEPNVSAQVAIADASLPVAGVRMNMASELKPYVDRSVAEQIAALQARARKDPALEQAARREWSKMCRSVSLGAIGADVSGLWLEVRPTRAFAAQPRIDASDMTLVLGVEAQTRIVPHETTPDCPFPEKLELVPQVEQGRVNIAVPIDVPFTEVNRLLASQLAGRTFVDDATGAFEATVERVSLAASGDRLLVSLRMKGRETKSLWNLGAEATVHVWGRPVLDRETQILRLIDVAVDIDSKAAFGLLGAAARAVLPLLETTLAEKAIVDLKPFAADARVAIDRAIRDLRQSADGVRVDAAVTDLRLVDIDFDSRTLRVIAEADGTVKVAATTLPKPDLQIGLPLSR
jgi:hypothetical protein